MEDIGNTIMMSPILYLFFKKKNSHISCSLNLPHDESYFILLVTKFSKRFFLSFYSDSTW